MPGPAQVRPDHAVCGDRSPIKQHLLDADMVMEPLEMAQARNCAGNMAMKRRRAVARQVDMAALAKPPDGEKSGNASTTGDIGLQDVHCIACQEVLGAIERVDVLTGGHVDSSGKPLADQMQTRDIVRADRLLEPSQTRFRALAYESQRL